MTRMNQMTRCAKAFAWRANEHELERAENARFADDTDAKGFFWAQTLLGACVRRQV